MFEGWRKKIGEAIEGAIESIKDGFKDVATLGKHSKIKEHAQQYEYTLGLIKRLQTEHEQSVLTLQVAVLELQEERAVAFESCRLCQCALSEQVVEITLSFPEVQAVPENKLTSHLRGVLDSNLQAAFTENKVGLASKTLVRYVATHKSAQQQFIKHPLIAAGAALIVDGINSLMSATKAATAQLNEIKEMELKATTYVYEYRNANSKISAVTSEINQDKSILNGLVLTLDKVKAQLLDLNKLICVNPGQFRRIIRWWRKLFRLNIFTKKELRKLNTARDSAILALTDINILLQKNYEL